MANILKYLWWGNQESTDSSKHNPQHSETKETVDKTTVGVDSTMHGETKDAVEIRVDETTVDESTVGVALLISNDYVNTAEKPLKSIHQEADKLGKLFEEFGYVVYKRRNVSKQALSSYCRKLSEYAYQPSCRRIVVYFSGHGDDGILQMQDGNVVMIDEIINRFKPFTAGNDVMGFMTRVFLFDSCRGGEEDYGYTWEKDSQSKKPPNQISCIKKLPYEGNTLVAYASTQYYPSYFDPDKGSFWTRCLIEALEKSKETDSLCTILTMANGLLSQMENEGRLQTATFTSNLRDEVFLRREAMDREQQYKGEY